MIQYIINSSLIWLAFLLLYEFLFRKESFHQFNRIFLLVGLFAGLILPQISLNRLMPVKNTASFISTVKVHEIKNTILENPMNQIATPIVESSNYSEQIIWGIYTIGLLIGILFLIWEIVGLVRLYRNGKKSNESGSIIIETKSEHCPFSFFNLVFIRSKQDYSELEWRLIFNHEKEHQRQFHIVDNLLIILLRILFWFNPLIHIYFKKLRIVHEFQADKIASDDIAQYGSFLLDLNLLQGSPILTHSFNYSPIKTRIAMLTKTRSTRIKLLKYLTVLPLFIVLIIFCTQTSFSGGLGNASSKVKYKSNLIEFGEFKVIPFENRKAMNLQNSMFLNASLPDSLPVFNYATGELLRMEKLLVEKVPVKINGKMIYGNEPQFMISKFESDFRAPIINSGKHLDEYLFLNLKDELDKLDDGVYAFRLNNLVIDDKGKIAFFDMATLDLDMSPDEKRPNYSEQSKQIIEKKFREILESPILFKPAIKNGKPINVRFGLGNYNIKVKNHTAKLIDRPGC